MKNQKIHFTPIVKSIPMQSRKVKMASFASKQLAHKLLERVFGSYTDLRARARGYEWLGRNSYSGHFRTMTSYDIDGVIKKLRRML